MWKVTLKKNEWLTELGKVGTMKMTFEFEKLQQVVDFLESVVAHSEITDFDLEYTAKVEVE